MLSYVRLGDELWDVPIVLFCVWSLVLFVSTLVALSCLKRETKKFNKRLARAENKFEYVTDLQYLDNLLARYVRSKLGLGVLATLANSFAENNDKPDSEDLRAKIQDWFNQRITEMKSMDFNPKQIKRTILAALRGGLMKHPLDIRGSRRSLEAAKIFLAMESKKGKGGSKVSFLQTTISMPKMDGGGDSSGGDRTVCPTIACDWIAANTLKTLSWLVSMPNSTALLFTFLSFCAWFLDTVTDMAIINQLWIFRLPILYPATDPSLSDDATTYLSYQTLTIDLYAPLLLAILLFSIVFTLLSCSCSRLSDKYRIASDFSKPESEAPAYMDQDPTTMLSRYDFNISSAITSSLPQFSLQFAAYTIIIYLLHTLKGLSVDEDVRNEIDEKVEKFSFSSLWMSGIASAIALIVAQYTAFKIQFEHCLTLSQRALYLLACTLNSISMMCSCLILVVVVFLPAATYIGRYHIMAIVILGGAALGIGFLISAVLAGFGLDPTTIQTDRISTVYNTDGLLTAYLRFTQTGQGKWRTILGATTLIGRIFSLLTVNLFLPPSQLLVHPFLRFYSTSPRSPALHYAIAKQVIYYNILTILSSIMLCVDIGHYGFNYNTTDTTRNLLIYANVCGVPCLLLALFTLFKFYASYDLWSSNGVHLVFQGDASIPDYYQQVDQTEFSLVNHTTTDIDDSIQEETEELTDKQVIEADLGKPGAESTIIVTEEEHNESTEADRADRITVVKKQSKLLLRKQSARINRRLKRSCLTDCLVDIATVDTRGKWIDVSDLPF